MVKHFVYVRGSVQAIHTPRLIIMSRYLRSFNVSVFLPAWLYFFHIHFFPLFMQQLADGEKLIAVVEATTT